MEVGSHFKLSIENFIFFIIFINLSLKLVVCQNCAVPKVVNVKPSSRLRETLGTGQFITSVIVKHVEEISNVIQNPGNFTQVSLNSTKDNNISEIILHVDKPLWNEEMEEESKSYTDRTRKRTVTIKIELKCDDGHFKVVQFDVPIIDENTVVPRFGDSHYELTTELCLKDRCTLTFQKDILIIDEDRDEGNAEVEVWTEDSSRIKIASVFNYQETWYGTVAETEEREFRKAKGFQTTIKLEYVSNSKSEDFQTPFHIDFTIFAKNKVNHVNGSEPTASANVLITFAELGNRMVPPVFSSSFYYLSVASCKELSAINPSNISANLPKYISNDTSVITYSIGSPECVFQIDSNTGYIEFRDDVSDEALEKLRNTFQTCIITAKRTRVNAKMTLEELETSKAHATLISFFMEDFDEPVSPPPTLPTTEVTPTTPDPTWEPSTPETTTQIVTTMEPEPTTEEPDPGKCTCGCDDNSFSCSNPPTYPSRNSSQFTTYPDLFQASTYHLCWKDVPRKTTHKCPEGKIFCSSIFVSACTDKDYCMRRMSLPCLKKDHDNYGACEAIPPGDPRNVCNKDNFEGTIEDPEFCDIFHKCQPTGFSDDYIDVPSKCPVGLKFCKGKDIETCVNLEDPACGKCEGKSFKQSNVCIMGQWEGFNLFTKKFEETESTLLRTI